MMNRTAIEWALNPDSTQGFTSNPVKGECPVGCSYCYVKPFRARYGWHKDIRFYPDELEAIRKRKKPAGIFLGSTIELFHDKTIQYMSKIMDTIKDCPQHRFYLLTKQPQNLIKFSPFPDNCWVGVTATDHHHYLDAVKHLREVEAKVKFLSLEPLLHRINVDYDCFDWVLIGAQTKPYKPPEIEWVEEIVRACDKAGVPVFLKDNLSPLLENDPLNPLYWANVSNDERGHERVVINVDFFTELIMELSLLAIVSDPLMQETLLTILTILS